MGKTSGSANWNKERLYLLRWNHSLYFDIVTSIGIGIAIGIDISIGANKDERPIRIKLNDQSNNNVHCNTASDAERRGS